MTIKKPDPDETMIEQALPVRPRKTTRKPGRDVNDVFRLSDDPEEEPEFLIQLPAHADVRKHVKRNFGGGDYLVKNRIGGKFKSERELHIEFTPDEIVAGELEDDPLEDDLAPEMPSSLSSPDTQELARAIATAIDAKFETREKAQRAEQGQPSTLDLLREVDKMAERRVEREHQRREEIRAEIASMLPQQNPAQQADQFAVFQKMFDSAIRLSERIMPLREAEQEGKGAVGHVVDFLRDAVQSPYVGPTVGAVVNGMAQSFAQRAAAQKQAATQAVSQVGPTQTSPAMGQATQESTQPEIDPFVQLLTGICEDCTRDAEVDACASAIQIFLENNPQYAAPVGNILSQSPVEILMALTQAMPQYGYLTKLPHSSDWIADLKAVLNGEVLEDEQEEGAPARAASLDGNGAYAKAAQ